MDLNKPELVMIVGSGASIPCGIPSTSDLTNIAIECLPTVVKKPPVAYVTAAGSHLSGMQTQTNLAMPLLEGLNGAFASVDFELIIHALLQLEHYAIDWERSSPDLRPVMTAFTDLLRRFDLLGHRGVLSVARHQIVNAIHKDIAAKCSQTYSQDDSNARAAQEAFIRRLSEHFRLVVIDLNYDDLLDRIAIGWSDGFTKIGKQNYALFRPEQWAKALAEKEHLLIHLHGSVRYGHYDLKDPKFITMHEPAKYDDPREAAGTFAGVSKSEPTAAGANVSAFPFITALDKAARLAHNVRPLGYQNVEAMLALARIPRLLVIGYGGRDPHLEAWIEEHQAIHGEGRRAVALSRLQSGLEPGHPLERLLTGLAKPQHLPDLSADVDAPFRKLGPLVLFPNGVPSAYAHADAIIDHFLQA